MKRKARAKTTKHETIALAGEIRDVRTRQGLTQGQLAERIGVSQQTVSDWEKGKRLRQVQTALRLARLLVL